MTGVQTCALPISLAAYGRDLVTAPFMLDVPLTDELTVGDYMPQAGMPVSRQPGASRWTGRSGASHDGAPSLLFDTAADPGEERDLLAARPEEAKRMRALLSSALEELGAPAEQKERLGL